MIVSALFFLLACGAGPAPQTPEPELVEQAQQAEVPTDAAPDEAGAEDEAADPAEGDEASDDEASGDEASGDEATGDEATDETTEAATVEKKADGAACLTADECSSGICEGEGCTDDAPGTCAPEMRACTRDRRPYCGCDGETFFSSGSCPGQRYAKAGPCE